MSSQSPSVNKQTKNEALLDISKYTCQDIITDVRDNNKIKAAVALLVAYTHAHDKLFPNNTTYDLDVENFAKAAEQNCSAGELSRLFESTVTNFLKQYHGPATEAQSPGEAAAGPEARAQDQPSPAAANLPRSQPAATAKSLPPGTWSMDCAKFTSIANNALNRIFGATNYSGSWVPVITNIPKGDSRSGNIFHNILAGHPEAGHSIAQLIAAFLAYDGVGGGLMGLFSTNATTLRALLLGLALEPQSLQYMDSVIVQAAIRRYGAVGGINAVRDLAQAVMDQVAEAAGEQREQVRTMLQANFGASGRMCTN